MTPQERSEYDKVQRREAARAQAAKVRASRIARGEAPGRIGRPRKVKIESAGSRPSMDVAPFENSGPNTVPAARLTTGRAKGAEGLLENHATEMAEKGR
jgi:hypothetical protein